ncbi:hypothetical protein Tco_0273920 [Tanacetum coccineum]
MRFHASLADLGRATTTLARRGSERVEKIHDRTILSTLVSSDVQFDGNPCEEMVVRNQGKFIREWCVEGGISAGHSEVEPVYVQNRVSVNEISSLKEGKLEWRKMVKCKYVRSGCTTALNVVPWETDGESVLREACLTRASFHDLLLFSYLSFIVSVFCFYPIRCFEAFRNLMCHNYALYGLNDIKTEAMRESDLS